MTTYIQSKSAVFMKYDDSRVAPRRRSESRLKRYSSSTNTSAWSQNLSERRKFIIDLMGREIFKKPCIIGELIPATTLWKILSAQQNQTINHLQDRNESFINLLKVVNFTHSQLHHVKQLINTEAFSLLQDVPVDTFSAGRYAHAEVQVQPTLTHTKSGTEQLSVNVGISTSPTIVQDTSSNTEFQHISDQICCSDCSVQVTRETVNKSTSVTKINTKAIMTQTEEKETFESEQELFSKLINYDDDELVTVRSECEQTCWNTSGTSVVQLFKSSNSTVSNTSANLKHCQSDCLMQVSNGENDSDIYYPSQDYVSMEDFGVQCSTSDHPSFLRNIISNIKNCVSYQSPPTVQHLISEGTNTRNTEDVGTCTEVRYQYFEGDLTTNKTCEIIGETMFHIDSIQKLMQNAETETEREELQSIAIKTSDSLIEQLRVLQNFYVESKDAQIQCGVIIHLEYSQVQFFDIPNDGTIPEMAQELKHLQQQIVDMTASAEEYKPLKEMVETLQNDLALYNNIKAELLPLSIDNNLEVTTMAEIKDMLVHIDDLKMKAEKLDTLKIQFEKERLDSSAVIKSLRKFNASIMLNMDQYQAKSKEVQCLRLECTRLQLKVVELEGRVREYERLNQLQYSDTDEGFKEDLSFASEQAEEIKKLNQEKQKFIKALIAKECEVAEQEEEIERLVQHVERFTNDNELQQEKTHKLLCQMRAQLDAKESYIAKMEGELEHVEEKLKASISAICKDSSELQQKIISLECACKKYKAQISELDNGHRVMQKQLRIQERLNKNYSKELQRKDDAIQQLTNTSGEPHYEHRMQKISKMENILRMSHNAMRRVVEELTRKYSQNTTELHNEMYENID